MTVVKEPVRPKAEDYPKGKMGIYHYAKAMKEFYMARRRWLKSLKVDEQWETHKEAKKEDKGRKTMRDSDFKKLQDKEQPQSSITKFFKEDNDV